MGKISMLNVPVSTDAQKKYLSALKDRNDAESSIGGFKNDTGTREKMDFKDMIQEKQQPKPVESEEETSNSSASGIQGIILPGMQLHMAAAEVQLIVGGGCEEAAKVEGAGVGDVSGGAWSLQSMKLEQPGMTAMTEAAGQNQTDAGKLVSMEGQNSLMNEQLQHSAEVQGNALLESGHSEEKHGVSTEEEAIGNQALEMLDGYLQKADGNSQTGVQGMEHSVSQETMKVSVPEEIPENLAGKIAEKIQAKNGQFEIQIEPKHLGRIAVKVEYLDGAASISIVCSESKTWELIKRNVNDISQIVQRNLHEETVVIVEEKQVNTYEQQGYSGNDAGRESEWERQREQRRRREQSHTNRFLQELRLGLVE